MTDIVERLRERARGGFAHDELDEEAADEIERLREALLQVANLTAKTEIEGLQAALQEITNLTANAEVERLKAERDKAWTKHLIEREELKAEIERLKAERHTTKEMLEDVLRRHGVLPSKTPHYGLGRAGIERKVGDD